jgi:hypothetical protein
MFTDLLLAVGFIAQRTTALYYINHPRLAPPILIFKFFRLIEKAYVELCIGLYQRFRGKKTQRTRVIKRIREIHSLIKALRFCLSPCYLVVILLIVINRVIQFLILLPMI